MEKLSSKYEARKGAERMSYNICQKRPDLVQWAEQLNNAEGSTWYFTSMQPLTWTTPRHTAERWWCWRDRSVGLGNQTDGQWSHGSEHRRSLVGVIARARYLAVPTYQLKRSSSARHMHRPSCRLARKAISDQTTSSNSAPSSPSMPNGATQSWLGLTQHGCDMPEQQKTLT